MKLNKSQQEYFRNRLDVMYHDALSDIEQRFRTEPVDRDWALVFQIAEEQGLTQRDVAQLLLDRVKERPGSVVLHSYHVLESLVGEGQIESRFPHRPEPAEGYREARDALDAAYQTAMDTVMLGDDAVAALRAFEAAHSPDLGG